MSLLHQSIVVLSMLYDIECPYIAEVDLGKEETQGIGSCISVSLLSPKVFKVHANSNRISIIESQ